MSLKPLRLEVCSTSVTKRIGPGLRLSRPGVQHIVFLLHSSGVGNRTNFRNVCGYNSIDGGQSPKDQLTYIEYLSLWQE